MDESKETTAKEESKGTTSNNDDGNNTAPKNLVEQAKETAERLEKAKAEAEAEADRLEKIKADEQLAGTAGGRVEPQKKELTQAEEDAKIAEELAQMK